MLTEDHDFVADITLMSVSTWNE